MRQHLNSVYIKTRTGRYLTLLNYNKWNTLRQGSLILFHGSVWKYETRKLTSFNDLGNDVQAAVKANSFCQDNTTNSIMNERIPLRWSGLVERGHLSLIAKLSVAGCPSAIHLLSVDVRTNRKACYWLRPAVSSRLSKTLYGNWFTKAKSDTKNTQDLLFHHLRGENCNYLRSYLTD